MADIAMPDALIKIAGICMVFLPLTFSWAIVRYRMMDVDLIFKRGVTYTLATAALVGVYFSLLAVAAALAQARLRSFGVWGLLAAIIVAALPVSYTHLDVYKRQVSQVLALRSLAHES